MLISLNLAGEKIKFTLTTKSRRIGQLILNYLYFAIEICDSLIKIIDNCSTGHKHFISINLMFFNMMTTFVIYYNTCIHC